MVPYCALGSVSGEAQLGVATGRGGGVNLP